jgi:hypothetical protein
MLRQRQMLGYLQLTCSYRATSLHQLPAQAQMLKARREENLQRCHRRGTAEGNVTALHLRRAAEGAAETSEAVATAESGTARQLRRAAVGDAETMQHQPLATSAATGGTALGLRRAAEGAAESSEAVATAESGTARQLRRAAVGDAETRQHQPRRLATSAATGGGGAALQLRRSTMLHQPRNVRDALQLRQPRRVGQETQQTRRSRTAADGGAALQLQSQLQRQQRRAGPPEIGRECGSQRAFRTPERRRRCCYRHRRPWGRLRCRTRSRRHRRRSESLHSRPPPKPPEKGAESMEQWWRWRHSPPRHRRRSRGARTVAARSSARKWSSTASRTARASITSASLRAHGPPRPLRPSRRGVQRMPQPEPENAALQSKPPPSRRRSSKHSSRT